MVLADSELRQLVGVEGGRQAELAEDVLGGHQAALLGLEAAVVVGGGLQHPGLGLAEVVPLPLHQTLAALQLDWGHTGSRGLYWLQNARHSFVLPLQRRFDLALWIVVGV